LELIAYYRNKNLSSIFEGITATSEFEVYLHESAETAAAFPFYDGKDGTINRVQVDLTKHGEIVDVRVDGSDHVENLSFNIKTPLTISTRRS
jgi:hypothetical protein